VRSRIHTLHHLFLTLPQALTLLLLMSIALLLAMPAHAATPAPFQYEDLFRVEQVVDAKISPDGSRVAVVTERRSPEAYHKRIGAIAIVARSGGEPRRIPAEAGASLQQPAWSPDGTQLLYRLNQDKRSELVVLDLASWQSRTLKPCVEGETAGAAAWAPDARQIAVVCGGQSPLLAAMEKKDDKAAAAKSLDDKRIIATRSSLYDDTQAKPWSAQRRVVVVPLGNGAPTEVMRSELVLEDPGALQWQRMDALWITAAPGNPFGGMAFVNGRVLHRFDATRGRLVSSSPTITSARMPLLVQAGGKFLIPVRGSLAGAEPKDFRHTWEAQPLELGEWTPGAKAAKPLAELDNIYVGRSATFLWSPRSTDGKTGGTLYFQWFDRGNTRIKAYHPGQGAAQRWQDLTPAGQSVAAFSLSADGRTMALVRGDGNTPMDVYLLDLATPDAQPSRLTHFGDAVLNTFAASSVETVQWRSGDDRFDIGGWLLKPPGYTAGKRYPLILLVHGGPGVSFHNTFDALHFDGAHQVPPESYLANGYLVLMINPRGDPGYGKAHQEALLEGWEYPTRYDLLVGVQEMVKRGYADPDRLGIAGASYGGWVTAFAVTQTDMFKAASAHDPVIDTQASSATAYRGNLMGNYWLHAGFVKNHLLDAPFPTADPRKVNTPILLRWGLREIPPMPSQFFVSGLEYFTYLHAHCKPVEMILHPEEGHGIYDGPTLRDYVERDLAWFRYWLEGKGELPYKPHECVR
jgi:dipeptidyl aminopeptidase/acylaminoacyl peptidase